MKKATSTDFRYYKGSKDSPETIEAMLYRNGRYITTAVVNVWLLTSGIRVFPCGSVDDYKFTGERYLDLLNFLKEKRDELKSGHEVKTKEMWYASGLPKFEDYFDAGDIVDDELVQSMTNSVPPTSNRYSCTQLGEAFDSAYDAISGRYRYIFGTFHRLGNNRWMFDGYCFKGENVNRLKRLSQIEMLIYEAQKEADRRRGG